MLKQWKNAGYVIRHSGGALLLLAACLLAAWLLGNDIGLDAVNDMKALEKKIPAVLEHAEQYGLEAYPEELTGLEGLAELETIIDPEELLSILRKRQILGAPAMTMDGMPFPVRAEQVSPAAPATDVEESPTTRLAPLRRKEPMFRRQSSSSLRRSVSGSIS